MSLEHVGLVIIAGLSLVGAGGFGVLALIDRESPVHNWREPFRFALFFVALAGLSGYFAVTA